MQSMDPINFKFKHVIIRVDFNVPLDSNLNVVDDMRITESLPSIDHIIDDGGIPIILSHLGRPSGSQERKYSLSSVAKYLQKKFGYNVIFADDCIGPSAIAAKERAKPGDVVMCENLRYHQGEKTNDMEFAKELAKLGDCYVNDAFGTVHRYHASIYALPSLFEQRYVGKSVQFELEYLNNALQNPRPPYVAVIGGAKITGKIEVIRTLINQCDKVLIGGGMMFTFLKAMGYNIGRSIYEEDKIPLAKELVDLSNEKGKVLMLPTDVVIADRFAADADALTVPVDRIPSDWIGMDIGEDTIKKYKEAIYQAHTITWNGPMGVFEFNKFARGTKQIGYALANATSEGSITIIGGGDSAAAMKKMHLINKVTHLCPGGGAWLKYMEGGELPGIEALK